MIYYWFVKKNQPTRMHSSRMRTGCLLTVCRSLLPGGVYLVPGVYLVLGGALSPGGCVSDPGGFLTQGGVWPSGVWPRGVWWGGVHLTQGVSLTWGLGVSDLGGWGLSDLGGVWPGGLLLEGSASDTPPLWTEWQTGVKILPWPQLHWGR